MTEQDAITRVWTHFIIDRNPPGFDPDERHCCYSAPNGARCAIGCLIDASEAHRLQEQFEGAVVGTIRAELRENAEARDAFPTTAALVSLDSEFVCKLQRAHDNAARSTTTPFHTALRQALESLAACYDLEVPSTPKETP